VEKWTCGNQRKWFPTPTYVNLCNSSCCGPDSKKVKEIFIHFGEVNVDKESSVPQPRDQRMVDVAPVESLKVVDARRLRHLQYVLRKSVATHKSRASSNTSRPHRKANQSAAKVVTPAHNNGYPPSCSVVPSPEWKEKKLH